ncbi:MAG TPA: hypothetical protein VHC98_01040 [Candidatus Saccharimonadales bacterium]|nr:hypothetical protein [Candidatus Saccharimonadales bacterium]
MIKLVYSFFLGLLLAVFVGLGVASFYTAPKAPEYPTVPETTKNETAAEAEQRQADEQYQAASRAYDQDSKDYNRNVAMIVLSAAVVLVVLGLALHTKTDVIADGLLLGGVFTLLYSIGRSFAGADPKYSFLATSAGLIITMVIGYVKFLNPRGTAEKPKRRA